MQRWITALAIVLLALAACSGSDAPAPVRHGGQDAARADRVPTPPVKPRHAGLGTDRPARAGIHTVRPGETVYALSRRYRVPIRAIIEANDLSPPYHLEVGQELDVPVPKRHVVRRGDTVYDISRAYGVPMSTLTRVNDIDPPYTIHPGEVLVIPVERGGRTQTADAGRGRDSGSPSRRRDASDDADAGAAQTAAADSGSGGDGSGQRASGPSAGRSDGGSGTAQGAQSKTSAPSDPGPARTQQAAAPRPKEIPNPPARSSGRFLWPVTGKVLADFGPQDGGLHNDGINIAAPRGTPIRAAENGVVAYVGNELKGFGNLLLIKHADTWVTAYAHTQEILVQHGQQVKRGQIVARVGSSGNVAKPQLHFEIRKGSKAKNPRTLLGQQQAARSPGRAGSTRAD